MVVRKATAAGKEGGHARHDLVARQPAMVPAPGIVMDAAELGVALLDHLGEAGDEAGRLDDQAFQRRLRDLERRYLLRRGDGGAAARAGEQRHLADDLARAEGGDVLLARRRMDADIHLALGEDEHRMAELALAHEHAAAREGARRLQRRAERVELAEVEHVDEERDGCNDVARMQVRPPETEGATFGRPRRRVKHGARP
jgi:hypothetical protein